MTAQMQLGIKDNSPAALDFLAKLCGKPVVMVGDMKFPPAAFTPSDELIESHLRNGFGEYATLAWHSAKEATTWRQHTWSA